ncbi:hypothetical protein OGAPHI_006063 [Ogataea philodendri]|uniref:THO complex subunit 2 n=1 Tax=Ogataea philodendri TaxID=1378263 RepID=A0A9P8NYM9_9ASCO|nr:uncharacterized protein OGAPHI_006063 [Ogataea philodendri]KAH3661884.1 hypothetical protein OGAPHI_006063 [Ogataea philodendri]
MTEETVNVAETSPFQYDWKYLDDTAISNWKQTVDTLTSQVVNKDVSPTEVFYEIVLCLNDFNTRISINNLITLANTIISTIPNVKERQELSIQFLIVFQASNPKPHLNAFIQSVRIDNQFKRQYLDYSILKTGLFPDYNKCYFNDARVNDYGVVTYSSLHESSEGYSKLAVELLDIFHQEDSLCKIGYYTRVIERLIGHFRLDLSRSALLMLSIFALNVDKNESLILEIIKKSIWVSKESSTLQSVVVSFLLDTDYKERVPVELKLIVLLIKEGLLEFHSIFNSLKPLEFESDANFVVVPRENQELEQLNTQHQQETKENAFKATASALALAAPLVLSDDEDEEMKDANKPMKAQDSTPIQKTIPVKEKTPYIAKIQFLKYILHYKMYNEAMFILVQYPFLPLIDEQICDSVNKLADEIVTPYYRQIGIKGIGETTEVTDFMLVSSFEDLVNFSNQFLCFTGTRIAQSALLFTKIIRILRHELQKGTDKQDVLQYFRKFVFPALAFANNMAVVNEAFSILSDFYPLQVRYNLYGEYQNVTVKTNDEIKQKHDIAEKKTKDILKRLSTENGGVQMRQLTRIAYCNPLAVTATFVNHIESYSSLSDLIVEASQFFGPFVWDALTFQLCNKLSSNRQAMQEDGLNYMQWIQNLSSFIGKLAKNRLHQFQLDPIITLIVKSLNNGQIDYIILVNELIASMSGVQQINNLTAKQVFLLNSESSLQKLVYMVIEDHRGDSRASSRKLLNCLTDLDVLGELFILLANLPDKIVDKSHAPLKILNRRCDELNSLIHTFTTLIDENLPTNVFVTKMVSLDMLIKQFRVRPVWAFQIWRRHLSRQLKANPGLIDELEADLCAVLSIDWDTMSASFYADFWQLSLYEICYEKISYSNELAEIKTKISTLNKKLVMSRKDKDFPKKELKRLERELSQLHSISAGVKNDGLTHEKNYQYKMEVLKSRKDQWFNDVTDEETISKSTSQILEHCLLPRLVHSPFDAVYSAEFLFLAHSLNAAGFSLVYLLNELFTASFMLPTFFTSTASETENFGIFYSQVLKQLNVWRSSEEVYNKTALGKEGDEEPSLTGLKPPGGDVLSHEEFRKTLFNWHKALQKQIIAALDSEQYTTRNNAIIFLKNLLGEFPVVEDHSELLTRKLSSIYATDTREDIKLASNALFVLTSSKKSGCMPIWEFYEMDPEEKEVLVKKREEKVAAERARLAELERIEREKREAERKEREKSNPTAKPYGLVGLQKREKKETKEPVKSDANEELEQKEAAKDPVLDTEDEDKMEGIDSEKSKPSTAEEPAKETSPEIKPEVGTNVDNEKNTEIRVEGESKETKQTSTEPETKSEAKEELVQDKSRTASKSPAPTGSSALLARLEEEKRLLLQRQVSNPTSSGSSPSSPLPPPPLPPPSNPPHRNFKNSRDYKQKDFSSHRKSASSRHNGADYNSDRPADRKRRYDGYSGPRNKRPHY